MVQFAVHASESNEGANTHARHAEHFFSSWFDKAADVKFFEAGFGPWCTSVDRLGAALKQQRQHLLRIAGRCLAREVLAHVSHRPARHDAPVQPAHTAASRIHLNGAVLFGTHNTFSAVLIAEH